jgi:hypothetical protein
VRLDLTLVLYWSSLAISAAAVVLFLWLMRGEKPEGVRREAKGEAPPPAESPPSRASSPDA